MPENYLDVTEEECVYENWGHSGICHQRQVVSVNQKPSLKVINPESYTRVQLFEHLFYLKNVILRNINNNIEGPKVTYGELLKWLGIWLLMETVIGPNRDGFFSSRPVNEFTAAPFRVVKFMTKRRFERILGVIRYNKTKVPSYKD